MLRPGVTIHALACAILLVASSLETTAQDLARFEHLTVDSGLSQNEVTVVLQDSLGFLWVGTPDGLNRYNGYDFAVFEFDPTDSTSISDNRITALLVAADGALWVGTADGLNRYDPAAVAFAAFHHDRRNEATNLRTLLEETIDLVVHGSGAGGDGMPVNIERDYDERIGEVTIVRQAIGRVVLNLLDNAVYAMREHASSEPGYTPTVVVRTADMGDDVRIVVEDNGPGIPDEVRVRLFEPFFTTKPTGAGTGLGLSLVHDIIHSHHGEITVESTPGEGATFTILLPKKQDVAAGAD